MRHAAVLWFPAALLALAALLAGGCALRQRASDLALDPRPELAVHVPLYPVNLAASGKPGEGKTTAAPPPIKGSAVEAPLGGITLEQAIQICLTSDPKLSAGFQGVIQAQAELKTAGTKPNPTLDISQTLNPLFRAFTPTKQGGPPQLDVGIAYPIDWWLFGKMAAAVAAARLGVDVSEYDYADRVRQRIGDVALAFLDVLEARALVALAERDLSNLRQVEDALKKGVKFGGKAGVDLNRISLDRLKSEQTLREARLALVQGKARLRAFFGRPDPDPSFDVVGNLEGEVVGGPVRVEELFAAALSSRPDIQSARASLARAQADVESEDRKAYPTVTPHAGYTHQFQKTTIAQPDADAWGISMTMTLPCYDRNQGARIKARSLAEQKGHELRLAEVELRSEVERLVQEYRTALLTARAVSNEQLRVASEVRESITRAYRAGGRTILDFLDAQRNYRDTYRLFITSRVGYYRAVVRLHTATGAWLKK